MKPKWRRAEAWGRRARWLAPVAVFALVPKCGLCLLAYVGLASALGLGGRELCGAPPASPVAWVPWLAVPGAVIGCIGFLPHRWFQRSARWRPGGAAGRK